MLCRAQHLAVYGIPCSLRVPCCPLTKVPGYKPRYICCTTLSNCSPLYMKSSQEGGEEESTLWRKELTAAQYDIFTAAVTLSVYPNCPHRVQVLFSGVKKIKVLKKLSKKFHIPRGSCSQTIPHQDVSSSCDFFHPHVILARHQMINKMKCRVNISGSTRSKWNTGIC